MKTREIAQNVKLGLFVLVGVILFLIGVVFIGSQNNVFSKTFRTYAVFRNVEGLQEGDNVWLSGVKIGTVKEVRIVKEGKVIVTLSLKYRQNQFIKKDATASIGSDGFIGNKIVVIRPGKAPALINDNDTLGSSSPADTQELLSVAKDVGENTRDITHNLRELTTRINEGQGIVGELVNDGEFAQDLRASADRLRITTMQTSQATEQLHAVIYKLNHGDGLISRLATDTSLAYVFDQTLANVKDVSRNSAEVSRGLGELIEKINDGNNALGVLLSDTTFANKLRETLDNAESASVKLDENMEAMQHNFLLRGYFRKKDKREKESN